MIYYMAFGVLLFAECGLCSVGRPRILAIKSL